MKKDVLNPNFGDGMRPKICGAERCPCGRAHAPGSNGPNLSGTGAVDASEAAAAMSGRAFKSFQ